MSKDPWGIDDEESPKALEAVPVSGLAALARSEVETQIETAKRYPRSINRFLKESIGMATLNEEIAGACMYTLSRSGEDIAGPSVRLAEIMAASYGNLHIGSRITDIGERMITAQGVSWDLEKNVRFSADVQRRITKRNGQRFGDDMIITTGNAASSIALRNAVFRSIPRAYVMQVYEVAKRTAVGTAQTLSTRRQAIFERLGKYHITPDRILARLGKRGIEDVTLEDLEVLIGLGTAVKESGNPDEVFPPVTAPKPEQSAVPVALEGKRAPAKAVVDAVFGPDGEAVEEEPAR
jgi:hypothetical protein